MNLKKLFVFFPLLIPVWEKVPFDSVNTTTPDAPYFADDASIKMQSDYLLKTQDARLRSKIAITLAYSENPAAIEILENCLQNEKNDYVQADILNALYNLKAHGNCKKLSMLKSLLNSPDKSVRALSASLCLRAANDLSSAYGLLDSESNEYVINFLWDEIASNPELIKHSKDSELDKFISSENIYQRIGALKVLAVKSDEPDKDPRLLKAVSDKNAFIRSSLASALAKREKGGEDLIKKLSEDKDVSVRAFIASSTPAPERSAVFIKLSGDPDDEVRKLACVSLGSYKDSESINALLARIGDKILQVRNAAESSIIRIAPGKDVLKRVGDELLGIPESRAAAITILGRLKDTRYSPAITKLLEGLDEAEADLIRRCITALGELDFKESWKTVSDRAVHKVADVREAVASTLGMLKMKESYETILKLSDDKSVNVSSQAFESMGWIADSYFTPKLTAAIKKTIAEYPANNRSYACWSLARINSPNQEIMNQMDDICMKKVLVIPMSPNTFDMDYVRISALFALIEFGRKDPVAKDKADNIIKAFLSPPRNGDDFSSMIGDALRDYARQAKAYANGEKPGPVAVKTRMPLFMIEEVKEKNVSQPE